MQEVAAAAMVHGVLLQHLDSRMAHQPQSCIVLLTVTQQQQPQKPVQQQQ